MKAGNQVRVFVPSEQRFSIYNYEDVYVKRDISKAIGNFVDDFDPDIIAVHAPNHNWLDDLLKCKRPIVSWIHGVEALFTAFHHYYFPLSLKGNLDKTLSLFMDTIKCISLRRFLHISTAVVYVSRWMKNATEKYTQMKHPMSFIIPNPIDTSLFRPINKDISSRLSKAICVRALGWKYGVDVAIRAFSNLKSANLTIVGNGPLKEYLIKLAKECSSNVFFTLKGIEHEKLPSLYSRFGFFVAPSRTEAQGVAMCEAMACGLPVIASRVGGIPEFVKNEFNGFLVPPDDPLRLRKAITLLVSKPKLCEHLSQNAMHLVKENLSKTKICQKEYAILKLAAGRT